MCGIVGMVVKANNGFSIKTEAIFNQLLYADAVRGDDSTGIIGIETDTSFHIAKEATAAAWFMNTLEVESLLPKTLYASGKAVIGHNRKKTMGKIDDTSAHPFVVKDHFAMVHNGTLHGHKQLANTEVDSEALAIVLEKAFGSKDRVGALGDTLETVNGAYALAIYDQRTNEVCLLRNSERPLFYAENELGWFWASEQGLLDWILSRNGCTNTVIVSVPVDTLVTICLDKNTSKEETITLKKALATPTAMVEGGGTSISKKGMKKLQKVVLNTTISWLPTDFVSTIIEGTSERFMLMGELLTCPFMHEVKGVINLRDSEVLLEDIDNKVCSGQVYAIDKHIVTGKVTFWVRDIKLQGGISNEENIAALSENELKKYQLKESSKRSIFSTGIQGVENYEDEHRTNAI